LGSAAVEEVFETARMGLTWGVVGEAGGEGNPRLALDALLRREERLVMDCSGRRIGKFGVEVTAVISLCGCKGSPDEVCGFGRRGELGADATAVDALKERPGALCGFRRRGELGADLVALEATTGNKERPDDVRMNEFGKDVVVDALLVSM